MTDEQIEELRILAEKASLTSRTFAEWDTEHPRWYKEGEGWSEGASLELAYEEARDAIVDFLCDVFDID